MNSKITTLVLILITFFVLIFFTRPLYYTFQENKDLQAQLQSQQAEKKQELGELQKIQSEVKSGSGEINAEVSKYSQAFTEDAVIDYIYTYVWDTGGLINIREINMDEWDVNEYGFNEGKVQVSLRVNDQNALLDFVEAMTNPTYEEGQQVFTFFIDNFSFPSGITGSFNITVPMKIFYR